MEKLMSESVNEIRIEIANTFGLSVENITDDMVKNFMGKVKETVKKDSAESYIDIQIQTCKGHKMAFLNSLGVLVEKGASLETLVELMAGIEPMRFEQKTFNRLKKEGTPAEIKAFEERTIKKSKEVKDAFNKMVKAAKKN